MVLIALQFISWCGRRVEDSLNNCSMKTVMYSRWLWLSQAVQEFSKKNTELPALTSDSATASPARDAVRVTVADLNGNDAPEFLTGDASLSSHKTTPSRPMIKMLSCLFPSRIWWMIDHWASGVRGACMVMPQSICEVVCRSVRTVAAYLSKKEMAPALA